MPQKIEEILSFRTDLSTFLVHLTRKYGGRSAKENLLQIISDWRLIAGEPQGPATSRLRQAGLSNDDQRVVCFTETPLEYVKLLSNEVEGRKCQFSKYGIVITKKQGRGRGLNPIWYLDSTPGGGRWMNKNFEKLIDLAIENQDVPDIQEIFRLSPFIEQMGTWSSTNKKEFWWEREWRYVGDFALPPRIIVLCPEKDFSEIGEYLPVGRRRPKLIDPDWSLERTIAHLADFPSEESAHP